MSRPLAVVTFGADPVRGVLVRDDDGRLSALWPDGGGDVVTRDRRGWLWDEYGRDEYPGRDRWGRPNIGQGTRLRVVSRRAADIRAAAVAAGVPA